MKAVKGNLVVRFYSRPNGKMKELEITNIYEEDADFFVKNDIMVSMEELIDGEFAIYGCPRSDFSEESEVLVLAKGRTCEETLKSLRQLCEQEFV